MGKIVTIVYALFGIPLFLLYLSNIGNILATSFKWTYSKMCKCGKKDKQMEPYRVQHTIDHPSQFPRFEVEDIDLGEGGIELQSRSYEGSEEGDVRIEHIEEDEEVEDETVTVPISLCLLIMVGYVMGGALLFQEWEKDWELLDGAYFSFISLTTIGFGDLVPGDSIQSEGLETGEVALSFVFCSLYLLIGMALIAMMFNLMQEEVSHKVKKFIARVKGVCTRGSDDLEDGDIVR